MNFISAFIDGIVGFVRRNPLTCVILLLIAVVAPSLFGFMLYVILGMVLVSIISALIFAWRLRRMQRQMEEQFRQHESEYTRYDRGNSSAEEGEVRVHATTAMPEKRVSDDVGEYVDFKEEKNPEPEK